MTSSFPRSFLRVLPPHPRRYPPTPLPHLVAPPPPTPTPAAATHGQSGVLSPTHLSALHFTVFGLGNRQYEHFNAMGRLVNKRLGELGAVPAYKYGEGDDDGTLAEDFESWKEDLWMGLKEHMHVGAANKGGPAGGAGAAAGGALAGARALCAWGLCGACVWHVRVGVRARGGVVVAPAARACVWVDGASMRAFARPRAHACRGPPSCCSRSAP
jgi:hypothetical protein